MAAEVEPNPSRMIQTIRKLIFQLSPMNVKDKNEQSRSVEDALRFEHNDMSERIDFHKNDTQMPKFLAEFFKSKEARKKTENYIKSYNFGGKSGLFKEFNEELHTLRDILQNKLEEHDLIEIKTACRHLTRIALKQCDADSLFHGTTGFTKTLKSKSSLRQTLKSNIVTRYKRQFGKEFEDQCSVDDLDAYFMALDNLQAMLDDEKITQNTKNFINIGFSLFLIHPFLLTASMIHVEFTRDKFGFKLPIQKVANIFSGYIDDLNSLHTVMAKLRIIHNNSKAYTQTSTVQGETGSYAQAEELPPSFPVNPVMQQNESTEAEADLSEQATTRPSVLPSSFTVLSTSSGYNQFTEYYIGILKNLIEKLNAITNTTNETHGGSNNHFVTIIANAEELMMLIQHSNTIQTIQSGVLSQVYYNVVRACSAIEKYFENVMENKEKIITICHYLIQDCLQNIRYLLDIENTNYKYVMEQRDMQAENQPERKPRTPVQRIQTPPVHTQTHRNSNESKTNRGLENERRMVKVPRYTNSEKRDKYINYYNQAKKILKKIGKELIEKRVNLVDITDDRKRTSIRHVVQNALKILHIIELKVESIHENKYWSYKVKKTKIHQQLIHAMKILDNIKEKETKNTFDNIETAMTHTSEHNYDMIHENIESVSENIKRMKIHIMNSMSGRAENLSKALDEVEFLNILQMYIEHDMYTFTNEYIELLTELVDEFVKYKNGTYPEIEQLQVIAYKSKTLKEFMFQKHSERTNANQKRRNVTKSVIDELDMMEKLKSKPYVLENIKGLKTQIMNTISGMKEIPNNIFYAILYEVEFLSILQMYIQDDMYMYTFTKEYIELLTELDNEFAKYKKGTYPGIKQLQGIAHKSQTWKEFMVRKKSERTNTNQSVANVTKSVMDELYKIQKTRPIPQSSQSSSKTLVVPPINSISEEARRKAEEFASTATKAAASTAQEGMKSMKSLMSKSSTMPLPGTYPKNSKITSPEAQALRQQIQNNYTHQAS